MADEDIKSRLEQELNFLEESYQAEVISKEEYNKGKARIEKKLSELNAGEEYLEIKVSEDITEEAPVQVESADDIIKEAARPVEEKKEGLEQNAEELCEKSLDATQEVDQKEEPNEEKAEGPKEKSSIVKYVYVAAVLSLMVLLIFSLKSCGKDEAIPAAAGQCSADSDCIKESLAGTCVSPGTESAECRFKEDVKANLMVINDQDCALCSTDSALSIIKEQFPNLNIDELDYKSSKTLVNDLRINSLPAYVFDGNITKTANFAGFEPALINVKDFYVLSEKASGSAYFFRRPQVKNKLDIYLSPSTASLIEPRIAEIINLFGTKLNVSVYSSTAAKAKEELAINTYPTFVLNNQYKFKGILPANAIKEKICAVSILDECKEELSKV